MRRVEGYRVGGSPPFIDDLKRRMVLFRKREEFLWLVRSFFRDRGFLEVDAPLLVEAPGMEPHLDPFEVRGWATGRSYFLPTSPEFYLKKLLAAGSGDIFSICPCFRDEAPSPRHGPEFLMLEWYRVGGSLESLVGDCERLLSRIGRDFLGGHPLVAGGGSCDLSSPCEVLELSDLMSEVAGVDWRGLETVEMWRGAASANGARADGSWSENDCFSYLLVHAVEPALKSRTSPVVLRGYPLFQGALARARASDGRVAERFELYLAGEEVANAYDELTDGMEMERRFGVFQQERIALGKPPHARDDGFIAATGRLPRCAGIALGLDRLFSLLEGVPLPEARHGTVESASF